MTEVPAKVRLVEERRNRVKANHKGIRGNSIHSTGLF